VKRQFSTAVFDRILQTQPNSAPASLIGPIFALQKLEQQIPGDLISLRLNSLFGERVGNFISASGKLEVICSNLEQRYEETQSEEDLIQYAQAKVDLARAMLGQREHEAAAECAGLALDLSSDIGKLVACRLSAHLTGGLANYYLGRMDESLEMFKAALNESGENPDVVCLLSQVLWAKGGDEERDVAREQLFTWWVSC
jgi:superkiller protein 3